MLMPFGVLPFLATSFGAAFWPFADISFTLDTFGGEATCSCYVRQYGDKSFKISLFSVSGLGVILLHL